MIDFLLQWSCAIQLQNKSLPEIKIHPDVWLEFVLTVEKEMHSTLSMTIAGEVLINDQVKILGFTFTRDKPF